jgi:hypothetical protein
MRSDPMRKPCGVLPQILGIILDSYWSDPMRKPCGVLPQILGIILDKVYHVQLACILAGRQSTVDILPR